MIPPMSGILRSIPSAPSSVSHRGRTAIPGSGRRNARAATGTAAIADAGHRGPAHPACSVPGDSPAAAATLRRSAGAAIETAAVPQAGSLARNAITSWTAAPAAASRHYRRRSQPENSSNRYNQNISRYRSHCRAPSGLPARSSGPHLHLNTTLYMAYVPSALFCMLVFPVRLLIL